MKLGLTATLIVWFATSSIAAGNNAWPESEVDCLAANIYHEARGESVHGQWLVAYVTRNRVKSKKFPNTYCAVIKQHRQFSWWEDRRIAKYPKDRLAWRVAVGIATYFILDDPITHHDASRGALYYHSTKVHPKWAKKKTYIGRVGHHLAYK